MPRKLTQAPKDPAREALLAAWGYMHRHPMLAPLASLMFMQPDTNFRHCPPDGRAVVFTNGELFVHPTRRLEVEEWIYVFAHCLLHLGFGHGEHAEIDGAWNVAGDLAIGHFLDQVKIGRPWPDLMLPEGYAGRDEQQLYRRFLHEGMPTDIANIGTGAPRGRDLWRSAATQNPGWYGNHPPNWRDALAAGLRTAVVVAVEVAGGHATSLLDDTAKLSLGNQARQWLMSHFPLLGALAAAFTLVEDPAMCQRMDIPIAAVSELMKEVYLNPHAMLDEVEMRFVLAHELMHVGLRHDARRQGRDPFFWNVACDYVINAWLVEMGVGRMPQQNLLYDPQLKAESAEAVYDRIVTDRRRLRKMATMRGNGAGEVLDDRAPEWWQSGAGMDLDAFYRSAMSQGLVYAESSGRGTIPAGLAEEIRSLAQPPPPWDVQLARWFDMFFPPLEKHRSFAHPSRRQMATPDIPRPSLYALDEERQARTFGVLLDTSGSMDRLTLARALGAVASYALSHDVPAARVVFCDAVAYDAGFLPTELIAERVTLKGRGGTVLQPGIDLLQRVEDFSPDAPILIITDGQCDVLTVRREHAYLIPQGATLPFTPRGPVFQMAKDGAASGSPSGKR